MWRTAILQFLRVLLQFSWEQVSSWSSLALIPHRPSETLRKIGECLYDKLVFNLAEQHLLWLLIVMLNPSQLDRTKSRVGWTTEPRQLSTAESQLEIFEFMTLAMRFLMKTEFAVFGKKCVN